MMTNKEAYVIINMTFKNEKLELERYLISRQKKL